MLKKISILIFLFLMISQAFAQNQNSKSQLAYQYYRDKEFDKAAILYQELYNKNSSSTYLNYLVKCYIGDAHYKKAEELLKKEIKIKKNEQSLLVQLGAVYLAAGDEKKANKLYEKAISKLNTDSRNLVIRLANAFISQREFKYAEQTYLKGKSLSKGQYSYGFELANVYYYSRDYQKMIEAYLDLLDESPHYLKSVQNRLQSTVYRQDDGSLNKILKTGLIRRIQKTDNIIYSELLIWMYLQEKSFGKAYIQTKALVKRNKEDGQRLVELGQLASNNIDYETAIKCYQFIIDLGAEKPLYLKAKVGYLLSLQAKVLSNKEVSDDDINNLLATYSSFLELMGDSPETIELSISYSHILAFYGKQSAKAIVILEDIIENKRVSRVLESKLKLELADILLLDNKIWEATFYYSQVIKANPNNVIGNKAQIKKAKLSYYSGDFLWAKGQLDVLKASTSKLIANDAFYLSSIIADNITDSIEEPMILFSKADLLIFQNKNEEALLILDSLQNAYPNHSLADDVLFKKAEINETMGNDSIAKKYYQKLIDKYYSDILADNAIMALAQLYSKESNPEKAMELYTRLLVDFPDSFFTTDARRKIVEYRDS